MQVDQLTGKMSALLGRSKHIDESAARYYLDEAGGDLKRAMELCGEHYC